MADGPVEVRSSMNVTLSHSLKQTKGSRHEGLSEHEKMHTDQLKKL